jgi:heat shock protein HslJ
MKMPAMSFCVILASLLVSACTPFTRFEGDSKTLAKLDGNWTVKYVAGKQIHEVSPKINFDTAKGTLTGHDGCNHINGKFTFDSGLLKSNVATTRMACPNDVARAASAEIHNLLTNGAEVVEIAIGKGHVLMLKNEAAEIRLIPGEYAGEREKSE